MNAKVIKFPKKTKKVLPFLKGIHFFYAWSKWEEIERGEFLHRVYDYKIGDYLVLVRSCSKCGIKQMKRNKA